jgi:hypothetical protein
MASFRTGRFGKATVTGVAIPLTQWSCKWDKSLQDTTSTSSYDGTTQQTWQEQLPGILRGEGSIQAHWDASSTPSSITNRIKLDPTVALVFSVDQTTVYASGNADLSDVEVTLNVDGTVDMTANFKTNGVWTVN